MSFRNDMTHILKNYGHKVLLQRNSRKLRCRCWDNDTSSPIARCPYCGGSGWVNRMEGHYVRNDEGSLAVSWPNRSSATEVGRPQLGQSIFFFSHDAHPKSGDIIFEVGWSHGRPTHVVNAYEIGYTYAQRGYSGRIEYYQAAASNKSFDRDRLSVRSIGDIVNYELISE